MSRGLGKLQRFIKEQIYAPSVNMIGSGLRWKADGVSSYRD